MNEAAQAQSQNERDLFLDIRAGMMQVSSALNRYARHQNRPALLILGKMIEAAANVIAAQYGIRVRE